MHVVISTHLVKPGMVEQAERRIDANGDRMEQAPGFRFRYRITSVENPQKITTVTGWDSQEDYQRDREAMRAARGGGDGGESPYEQIIQEAFTLGREQVAASKAR
jgi:heme-degrading monooxygenase HmoA